MAKDVFKISVKSNSTRSVEILATERHHSLAPWPKRRKAYMQRFITTLVPISVSIDVYNTEVLSAEWHKSVV